MVEIYDPKSGESLTFPLNVDDSLSLNNLQQYFPSSFGLVYKQGEKKTIVNLDPSSKNLLKPAGGWENKTFSVYYNRESQNDEPESKRARYAPSEDSYPIAFGLKKHMLYFLLTKVDGVFQEGTIKNCATIATKTHVFTAGHCIPEGLPENHTFNLYNGIGRSYKVRLAKLYDLNVVDAAILEIVEGCFDDVPRGIRMPVAGELYFIWGYDGEYPEADLSCFYGWFRNTTIYADQRYILGSSGTTDGCSGGGAFDESGYLLGICVSGKLNCLNNIGTFIDQIHFLNRKYTQPSYSHIVPAAFFCLENLKL